MRAPAFRVTSSPPFCPPAFPVSVIASAHIGVFPQWSRRKESWYFCGAGRVPSGVGRGELSPSSPRPDQWPASMPTRPRCLARPRVKGKSRSITFSRTDPMSHVPAARVSVRKLSFSQPLRRPARTVRARETAPAEMLGFLRLVGTHPTTHAPACFLGPPQNPHTSHPYAQLPRRYH